MPAAPLSAVPARAAVVPWRLARPCAGRPWLAPRGAWPGLLWLALAMASAASPALAELQTVVVKGQALRVAGASHSVTTLDAEDVRDALVTQPEELLRRVPGVVVRGLALGGVVNSVSIRGFAAGAHGGDLGMALDGVPLNEAMSHADGYADLHVVVPLEIERVQVIRGPVSALYGNFNRGGVLALQTRHGGRYALAEASAGSFGTGDAQLALGAPLAGGDFNGAAQLHRTRGFRPGFAHDRGTLAGRWTLEPVAGTRLSLSARGHRGDWDSAGNVARAQFEGADPRGRDPRVVADGGLKRYGHLRADANRELVPGLRLLVFVYGNRQDYTRFFTRPVGAGVWSQREETYDRAVGGAGFSLNGAAVLPAGAARAPLRWTAGVERYRERTDFLNFEGTRARQRVGAAVYDRRYHFDSDAVFGEAELDLGAGLHPTLGLRWDRFAGTCQRRGPETGPDGCDRLQPVERATPKLGLRLRAAPGLDLRASVAQGFALPPNAVKYSAGAAALEPTVLRQTELGLAWSAGPALRVDLALFRIDSRREVRSVAPGVFENFGSTRREGLEVAATARSLTHLVLDAAAARIDARVRAHADTALRGRTLTGVPERSATLGLAWRPPEGWGGGAELRHVGRQAVDAANTVFLPSVTTLDLTLGYAAEAGAGRRWRAFAKLENATDRLYAGSSSLAGGEQTFNVAAPRGLRVGVQAEF